MNSFMEENLAEGRRGDIIHEMTDIRLQEQALKVRVHHPNWFTQVMQGLGQWLIARGEGLVRRYEIPTNNCTTSSEHGYAH